jgi:urease accessory protein
MHHKKLARTAGTLVLALLAASAAQAHPGHDTHGFTSGFTHPFLGLDHLLAMAVVGVWSAAALTGARRLAGPAVFLAMLLLGSALPQLGIALPGVETGVALSVVVLGALMFGARQMPAAAGLALVGTAALLHGVAHGSEMAVGQSFAGYAAGFMLASALLHGAGLLAGGWLQSQRSWLWRGMAALVGGSGVLMLASRL